ncbi:protein NLRC3 [Anarrhichthys ocellatus]|uniref:protein NLRC3 n=1 Tax=Anarrhichthys ocellatus TaxID=433405 RepID=UPI0012EEC67F|nr:protein NLRC3-like [Anarrhichthys ocellatus]
MDPDTEVERIFRQENSEEDEEKEEKMKRPPSSYGSMKSDDDVMEEEEKMEEADKVSFSFLFPMALPASTAHDGTGLQMIRSASPETLYTMTTQQTRPPGAVVIDTRSSDLGDFSEPDDEEEDADEILIANSPEPPEPVEPEDEMQDENGQPGRLHPEQDLPHIFKSIQNVLTGLTSDDLLKFKVSFYQWEPKMSLPQVMEGDLLDFVDRSLEMLGQDRSLLHTINTLENIAKKPEAEELRNSCKRALIRYRLKQYLIEKHQIIREGVVRAGRQNLLDNIYVEPHVTTRGYGGVDPSHEYGRSPMSPSTLQVPTADTFVGLNNLFRLKTGDGKPVRTVVTTGIPGIGLTVSVGRVSLDWAELKANKDLQFVIKLSFRTFWLLRKKELALSQKSSVVELIQYHNPECKDLKHLEEEDCKFLIIMDSFDCYQASLDWQNAPVINDNYTQAHPDVLIVNIIRGTVLRGARVWILGRQAAVSQIPSQYIDVVTELQSFSDEKVDEFLSIRFCNAELTSNILAHYKRLPSLRILARHPLVCWMVATVFERCYKYRDYGVHPPRLTPFHGSILIFQTNRNMEYYYGLPENDLKWGTDENNQLNKIGKMALKMLERNTGVFFEEDVKEFGMKVTDVTVFSGLCTELPSAASDRKRTYCFLHFSFQEFIAALYVFTMFRSECKNVLDTALLHKPKLFASKDQTKSAVGLVQCALARTLASPPGHYDMFLRFLCGMLNPDCHDSLMRGCLYSHRAPKVAGLDDVQRLLEQTILTAEENRVENLKECLREMIQKDE